MVEYKKKIIKTAIVHMSMNRQMIPENNEHFFFLCNNASWRTFIIVLFLSSYRKKTPSIVK